MEGSGLRQLRQLPEPTGCSGAGVTEPVELPHVLSGKSSGTVSGHRDAFIRFTGLGLTPGARAVPKARVAECSILEQELGASSGTLKSFVWSCSCFLL